MAESKTSIPSSQSARQPRPLDLRKLQAQQDTLQTRLLDLKDSLTEKDLVLKSQRNTIKLLEQKVAGLQQNNATLRQIVAALSRHISEELGETLPALPQVPEEEEPMRMDPVSLLNPKSPHRGRKGRKAVTSTVQSPVPPLSSFSAAFRQQKGFVRAAKSKPLAFDPALSQNLFEDFLGADFLKAILDAEIAREGFEKTSRFLLGKVSKDILLFQTKTILFEALSFFLSVRNVAYQNASEVFLPRVLEMLLDVLEVERVLLYIYDPQSQSFYSRAVTADLPEQLVFSKDFGHFSTVYTSQSAVVLQNAYSDGKFDAGYDQATGVITQNLACFPVFLGDKLLGLLECVNKRLPFGPTDLLVLAQVARQLAIGLTGQEIHEKMRDMTKKATNRGSIDSTKEILLFPLIESLISAVQTQVTCERATIFLLDSKEKELVALHGTGLQGVIRMPLSRGIASLAFNTKSTINVPRAEEHSMFNPDLDRKTGFATREVLAVPIGSRGVLECLNRKNLTPFSKSDESRACAIAEVLSRLLDTADNLEGVLLNADFNELCVQAVKVAILHVNSQGLLQKVNHCAADVFQLTPERMVGMTLSELLADSPDLMVDFREAVGRSTAHSGKNRRLVVVKESKRRAEARVEVTICPLLNVADGPAFLLLLTPSS